MPLNHDEACRLAVGLKKGDVVFWKDYDCDDGCKKDKLVLLISDCLEGKAFIVVLPTSQIQYYVNDRRTMVDVVCFAAGTNSFFVKDTVVDLKNIMPLSVSKLVPHFETGIAIVSGSLSSAEITIIDGAVRDAETISPKYQRYILGEQ
jgi:hypothetical protein